MAEIEMHCAKGHALYGVQDVQCQDCDAERIHDLEDALVYSAFAQHGTQQYMLPKGLTLIDNDRVEVTLKDGRKVTARSGEVPK